MRKEAFEEATNTEKRRKIKRGSPYVMSYFQKGKSERKKKIDRRKRKIERKRKGKREGKGA